MAKKIYGLASVQLGPIAEDGGMGTVLTEVLGATARGTASLTYTEPTVEDVEIEEEDLPFDQLITTSGKWEMALESYNVSAEAMGTVCGGTYTPAVVDPATPASWEGDDVVHQEMSCKVTTRNGVTIDIPRLKFICRPNFTFDKGQLGRLVLSGAALKPAKAGTKAVKLVESAA